MRAFLVFCLALFVELSAIAYDASVITVDDLKVLKDFDKNYYALRKATAKRQSIGEVVRWCWSNMRYSTNIGSFDAGAYTEVQQQTYYAPASSVQGVYATYRPSDQSTIKISRDTLGRTRIDALLNMGIFDNADVQRYAQQTTIDKTTIAALVGEIAALRNELALSNVASQASQLEEVRLKARSKTGVIAEDLRIEHLSKLTETQKLISQKEALYEAKLMQLEIYIQGDKLESFYKMIDDKL